MRLDAAKAEADRKPRQAKEKLVYLPFRSVNKPSFSRQKWMAMKLTSMTLKVRTEIITVSLLRRKGSALPRGYAGGG